MKQVLIVENSTTPLVEKAIVPVSSSKQSYIVGGEFTRFDVLNRNDRIYKANQFLPALQELNERMQTLGVVFGELDHPDDFSQSLARTSHSLVNVDYVKEENCVKGKIRLLSTHWGKEARALVFEDNMPIFVSSRAAGVTESDGSVGIRKLFTYDIVSDPGFGTSRMSPINESLGYSTNKNYRIYEMADDSKINDIFNMNNNDFVTKDMLSEYSEHLISQINKSQSAITKSIKGGKVAPETIQKMLEEYESLQETQAKMIKYLDYLSEKMQIVVNENESLKNSTKKLESTTGRLIEHSDYLAENIEKTIEYSEYVAENLDKNIIYSEYLAENLDKNIVYSEYIAENLDKNIAYSEYIAENLDKNIAYSEYIAENLDKSIVYGEYLAEHLDNSIVYSEYIAENVEGNIKYAEYIAENLDDTMAYNEYLAENLDKSIQYTGKIVEKLNNKFVGKLNESFDDEDEFPTLDEIGFGYTDDDEDDDVETFTTDFVDDDGDVETEIDTFIDSDDDGEFDREETTICDDDGDCYVEEDDDLLDVESNLNFDEQEFTGESNTELSLQIDKLIQEAKKRKISEKQDLHFLNFLNKSQINSYYDLNDDEKEQVKLHMEGKTFFSGSDVTRLISEALSVKNESIEEKLVRLMPDTIRPIWNQLNENSKKSIFSQAKLYPNLDSDDMIENFWTTRKLKKNESVTKKLVEQNSLIMEDKLSDNEFKSIMERFNNL